MSEENYENGFSVVLPNYNGRHLLEKNLPPLYAALNEAELSYEVIVSDDCSTDDSIEYLKRNYASITIASTSKNSGFSTACNTGIAEARYRYTCIVNTDVTFDGNYFKNSIKYFENPNLFAIKGDIFNYRERPDNILNVDKDFVVYFKRGFFKFKAAEQRKTVKYDHILLLLGCCFVCRTELIKKIGGFDERFSPYFWEDLDLALTALEKGYDLVYAPNCIVYHQVSSTINKTQSDIKKRLISNRNKFILAWKHLGSPARWSIHAFFVFASLCLRWIMLDWRYYVSFLYALARYAKTNEATSSSFNVK